MSRAVCSICTCYLAIFKLHNLIHVYVMLTLMITAITLGKESTASASGLATDIVFVSIYSWCNSSPRPG